MKLYLMTLVGVASLSACSTAQAHAAHNFAYGKSGGWVLNPAKCPDLVEDWRDRRESRRDEAYDHGPRDVIEDWVDRRESRRDEAVTYCPARAWEWRGGRYVAHKHGPRPVRVNIFYHPHKRTYYHKHGHRHIAVRF
ncbi:MAG: hypothetical protein EX271_13480 [Acidimicrobiales bacterium]|nr:MAG: hypothetical protein EX271_13480 [Acidimicrobiales bacterium]